MRRSPLRAFRWHNELPAAVSFAIPREALYTLALMKGGAPEQPTVLIVDDEPSIRRLYRSALRTLPVRLLDASNGLDAMNLIEQEKPDLVVTDYAMPDWDGLEVCHQIRERPELQHIKIILITGQATPPFLLEGRRGLARDQDDLDVLQFGTL